MRGIFDLGENTHRYYTFCHFRFSERNIRYTLDSGPRFDSDFPERFITRIARVFATHLFLSIF